MNGSLIGSRTPLVPEFLVVPGASCSQKLQVPPPPYPGPVMRVVLHPLGLPLTPLQHALVLTTLTCSLVPEPPFELPATPLLVHRHPAGFSKAACLMPDTKVCLPPKRILSGPWGRQRILRDTHIHIHTEKRKKMDKLDFIKIKSSCSYQNTSLRK